MKKFHLLLLFIPVLIGCKETYKEEDADSFYLIKKAEGTVIRSYPNHIPMEIYRINDQGHYEGYSFSYHKSGALLKTTPWIKGKKNGIEIVFGSSGDVKETRTYQHGLLNGNTFRFDNGILTSHQINRNGNTWYEGYYRETKKYMNKLYPLFIEEFFFEDKYYAKIKFPLDHAGQMKIRVNDRGAPVIENLDKQTYQLVINDALDLNGYELALEYLPAAIDTLIHSRYLFFHHIYKTD